MHYKTNRQNHDFQLAYFLAGSCQTPDAAWSLLCDLRDDRRDALNFAKAASIRENVKLIRARANLASEDECTRLEAEATILEMESTRDTAQKNIYAAEAELAMILKLQEKLQPLRKFAHLPDAEAHEAAQAEEWKLTLIRRSENFMITQGYIPADHFDTMRLHPAFRTDIYPAIEALNKRIAYVRSSGKPLIEALSSKQDSPILPLLISSPE